MKTTIISLRDEFFFSFSFFLYRATLYITLRVMKSVKKSPRIVDSRIEYISKLCDV